MKSSTHKDTATKSREEFRHDVIFLPSNKDNILSYQFKLPMASINQYPRKNKYQLQYRLGKSWICDTTNTVSWLSPPNSSLEYDSFDTYKSMSSRSAKIMRALSSTHNSFRNESIGIRKSLNFDSSPSPKENNSYNESSVGSINTDTPSSILNSSPINSTDSNVPIASMESMDENQNKTPQQNRRYVNKSSNRSDIENIRSRTSYLMSLLEKEGNEGINRHANHRVSSRVITTSTPRNLVLEFNQEISHNRPHTPENMIDVIPESISAIKKSHKKEKWHCHEEQLSTQRMDVSLKNDNFDPTTKSSETNIIVKASSSFAAENESQKKNKNIKRTLVYNDKGPYARLDFNHSIQQKTMMENDLLASRLDQTENEMQDIESNKNKSDEESMQVKLIDNDDKDLSKESICDEEVSWLSLQRDSEICNVSTNRIVSPGCNSSASQDASKVVTPENDVNMLKHVLLTESIKKSHKKMKHASRKTLFKTKNSQKIEKKAELEMSIEDVCNDDQDINSQTIDMIHFSSPEDLKFDRPGTPENINSSRLLLLDFNSVKKSHKKDKRSKTTSSFVQCHDYEHCKKSRRLKEEEISCRDEHLGLKDSPEVLPKKKKSISRSLHSSTPKMMNDFKLLGCKNIDEEFKIHTSIKKPSILFTVTNRVSANEMSQEEDKFILGTSKEIDCSRCETPVGRCFKKLKENKDLALEYDNAKNFETDLSMSKSADTAHLKDKNGRSTPINMSTTELLCNVDSIKKSHKKDKHDYNKKPILRKKRSYIEESANVNFANNEMMLEDPFSPLHHIDNHRTEKEICMRKKERVKSCKETAYDDPQPSTSRGDDIESARNTTRSEYNYLNITPPNSLGAINLRKLLHTTSIKKSHKKERDMNAQTKYIFMSQDSELSDDGSIFDETDKLNYIEKEISTM
ncbi:uncharacterized protein LOC105831559 [Monomorium pharaonis]|uniref:uncharacterized protein LOC105831559 n=1 Tax=Monomorium pharaonis TaxID=307658 RepID=UPI00063F8B61|nr:uncharacterized protein LOC105831559 [Monomorium pharaonis]